MNKIVFTLLWIVSLCYASKNYTKLRFLDYVLIVLLTYGMYDAWKQTDEHFTASGYSEGMDAKAYENLHRIVKELYNNDTLTIPASKVIFRGDIEVNGSAQVTNNTSSGEITGNKLHINSIHPILDHKTVSISDTAFFRELVNSNGDKQQSEIQNVGIIRADGSSENTHTKDMMILSTGNIHLDADADKSGHEYVTFSHGKMSNKKRL